MASYVLRINYPNNKARSVPLNRLLAVPAEAGAHYQVLDSIHRQPVDGVVLKQMGNNLIVEVQHQPIVHINRYYSVSQVSFEGGIVANAPAAEPPTPRYNTEQAEQTPPAKGWGMPDIGWGKVLLGGAAVGGLLALASGGKKDSASSGGSGTGNGNIVTGTVMGGPVVDGNDLKVIVYKGSVSEANKLGNSTVDKNGIFTLDIGTQTGVIIVKVFNGASAKDYLDEATNDKKDLNATYFAVGELGANEKKLSLNVNPITTIAYHEMGSSITSTLAQQVNNAIAQSFKLGDLHKTTVVPVTDASFNATELTSGEQYGLMLAILSGIDKNKAGNSQATIDAIKDGLSIDGNSIVLNDATRTLLNEGATTYNANASKTFAIITSATSSSIDENANISTVAYQIVASGKAPFSYTLSGSDAAAFNVDNTGKLTLKSSADYETKTSYSLTVQIADAASSKASQAITINVNNKDDTAPVFSSATSASVNENVAAGSVVYTAVAQDAENSIPLTYALKSGGNASAFSINSSTGAISIIASPNYEDSTLPSHSYSFTVQATDAANNTREQAVTLTINNRDEVAPSITSSASATAITEHTKVNEVIYTATATDPAEDGGPSAITFSLKPTNDFSIHASTGAVTLKADTNAAISPARFTVIATDAAGNAVEKEVSLPITSSDTSPPTVSEIVLANPPSSGAFRAGDVVTAQVIMSEAVTMTGKPLLALNIGGSSVNASYDSMIGNSTLQFKYTLAAGLTDSNGISINADSLSLNSGADLATIKDAAGNVAVLTHSAVADNASYMVDTAGPTAKLVNPAAEQLEAIGKSNGEDYLPQLSKVGSSGEFVVVWRGQDTVGSSANNLSLFVQKFNADGTTTGQTPVQLDALGTSNKADFPPSVTTLGTSGQFVVTWMAYDNSGGQKIAVQKFNADGTKASTTPEYIAAFANTFDSNHQSPKVSAVGNSGEFVVTWSGIDAAWTHFAAEPANSIHVQKFNSSGTASGAVVQLKGISSGNKDYNPEITTLGSAGEFAITWFGKDSAGDNSIFVQKFNSTGSATGSMVTLEAIGNSTGSDYAPKISAVGNSGDYVVVWYGQDSSSGNDLSVFVQKFNADGTAASTPPTQLEAHNNSTGNDNMPVITALDSTGKFAVAWQGANSTNDGNSIFVQTFSATGTARAAPPIQLDAGNNTAADNQLASIAAIGNSGEFVVAWQGKDFAGDYNIYLQKFNADGTRNGEQIVLEARGNSAGNDIAPQIQAHDSSGAFVVSWQGVDRAGDNSIFVQKINADGTLNQAVQANKIIAPSGSIVTTSSEVGQIYLVNSSVSVSKLSDISNANVSLWTSKDITTANAEVSIPTAGLVSGDYKIFSADSSGNLSVAASNTVSITSISSVAISGSSAASGKNLHTGDTIQATATFLTPVTVTGAPKLSLDLNGKSVDASYKSGSGSNALIFEYTITSSDNDANGVGIRSDSLSLNGGAIKDGNNNTVNLSHIYAADNSTYIIDNTAATSRFANAGTVASTDTVKVLTNEAATVYMVKSDVTVNQLSDITGAAANKWSSVSVAAKDTLTAISISNLQAGSYKLYSVDSLQNFSSTPSSDTVTISSSVNSNIVVFDMIEGVSSAHSERTFASGKTYTIYARIDSDFLGLNVDGSSKASWAAWQGGNNLGADDKVVLVGNGSAVLGNKNGAIDALSRKATAVTWLTAGTGYAAKLNQYGYLQRITAQYNAQTLTNIWDGQWANPNAGQNAPALLYLTAMPAGILTSQGLV